jgi:hypothetical protein
MKIISGGQTGADRAALDAAMELGIPHGGWLPRGRKTEDGPLADRYALQELDSARYRDRTEKNILESDATLVISFGPLTGGSALTEALAIRHERPCLHLNMEHYSVSGAAEALQQWLKQHGVSTLNVAGPRASGDPRIYETVKEILQMVHWNDC